MSRHWIPSVTAVCGLLLPACGASDTAEQATAEPGPKPSMALDVSVEPADEATAMKAACARGAQEQCDAIDDDCDRRVDEGCGYGGGELQVTVAWGAGADLDLEVTEPGGETLGGETGSTASGGRLERTGEGRCEGPEVERRLEVAQWPEDPPTGEYAIALRHVDPCDVEGPVTATVTVSVHGYVSSVYNRTVEPSATARVATMRVSRRREPATP